MNSQSDGAMTVIGLHVKNVMRVKAVDIEPSAIGVVTIGGENASGKSTILNSIWMALGGKDAVPDEPIRRGSKEAEIKLDLGQIEVCRKFTRSNPRGYIEVVAKDGSSIRSPQALLDSLAQKLAFDPLAFSKMDAHKQSATLKELAGLDTKSHEEAIRDAEQRRRDAKRDAAKLEVELKAQEKGEDVDPVDITPLRVELSSAQPIQREKSEAEVNLRCAESELQTYKQMKSEYEQQLVKAMDTVSKLENQIALAEKHISDASRATSEKKAALDSIIVPDTSEILKKIDHAEEINRRAAVHKAWKTKNMAFKIKEAEVERIEKMVESLRNKLRQAISEAKYPVDGLSVAEDGEVLFSGIPFSQCSTAERLRVCVGMAMAMNPRLRVILIREGNDLDSKSLGIVKELAVERGYQIWIERVEDESGRTEFFISDGTIE